MVRSELKLGTTNVRLAGSVKLCKCLSHCLQSREETDKVATVGDRGRLLGWLF